MNSRKPGKARFFKSISLNFNKMEINESSGFVAGNDFDFLSHQSIKIWCLCCAKEDRESNIPGHIHLDRGTTASLKIILLQHSPMTTYQLLH